MRPGFLKTNSLSLKRNTSIWSSQGDQKRPSDTTNKHNIIFITKLSSNYRPKTTDLKLISLLRTKGKLSEKDVKCRCCKFFYPKRVVVFAALTSVIRLRAMHGETYLLTDRSVGQRNGKIK